jgi:hypothetical protein
MLFSDFFGGRPFKKEKRKKKKKKTKKEKRKSCLVSRHKRMDKEATLFLHKLFDKRFA